MENYHKAASIVARNHRNYICDLHFEPQYIRKTDKKCSILKEAVPNLKYVFRLIL